VEFRLVRRAVLLGQFGDVGQIGFADQHACAGKLVGAEGVGGGAHLLHHGVGAGQVVGPGVVQGDVAIIVEIRLAVLVLENVFVGQVWIFNRVVMASNRNRPRRASTRTRRCP